MPHRPACRAALRAALLALVLTPALAGCVATVSLEPAPDANNPACADVTVRLPERIDTLAALETDAQATGAWGDPVAVILRCGVEVPGPSTLPCIEVAGVQWLRDASAEPNYLFTTYGRDPAIAVAVDSELLSPGIALDLLSNAVARSPRTERSCTSLEETVTGAELFSEG